MSMIAFLECTQVLVTRLPFLTHPRFVEFAGFPTDSFHLLNLFLKTLSSSLQSPATLEHLKLRCDIMSHRVGSFTHAIRALDVWVELDSLANNPRYARLRRIDLNITLFVQDVEIYVETGSAPRERLQVQNMLPQKLPLLSSKGILRLLVQSVEG